MFFCCQTTRGKCHCLGYVTSHAFQNKSLSVVYEKMVSLTFVHVKHWFFWEPSTFCVCVLKPHLRILRIQVMLSPLCFSTQQFYTVGLCKTYNKWIIITELLLKFSSGFSAELTVYLFYGFGVFLSTFGSLGILEIIFSS